MYLLVWSLDFCCHFKYIRQFLSLPALYSASNTMRKCVYHCIVFNSNRSNAIVRLIVDIIIAIYTLMLLSLFYASMVGPFYRFDGETKNSSTCRNLESSVSQVYFLISRLNFIPYANVVFLHSVEILDLHGHGVYVFVLFGLGLFEFIKQVKRNNSILNIILTLVYHKENPLDKTRAHTDTLSATWICQVSSEFSTMWLNLIFLIEKCV